MDKLLVKFVAFLEKCKNFQWMVIDEICKFYESMMAMKN